MMKLEKILLWRGNHNSFLLSILMLKEWYKIYFTLVHRVIILIWRSQRLPHSSRDQTVAEPHPDALPDVHLDLVVILKTLSLSFTACLHCLPITGYGGARTPSNFLRSSVYIICACSRLFFSSSVLAASDRISVSASSFRPCNDHESVILLTVWQKWKRVWSLIGGKDTHEEFRNASLLTSPSPNSNPAPNPKESNPKRSKILWATA